MFVGHLSTARTASDTCSWFMMRPHSIPSINVKERNGGRLNFAFKSGTQQRECHLEDVYTRNLSEPMHPLCGWQGPSTPLLTR